MQIRSALAALALLALVPFSAFAKTHTLADAKVTFDAPDSWKVEKDDGMTAVGNEADDAGVVILTLDAENIEKGLEAASAELEKLVKDPQPSGEPSEAPIGGMKAMLASATAKVDGEDVKVDLLVLESKSGKFLIGIGITKKSSKDASESLKLLKSFKAAAN
jgi:hypothetical protein